MKPMSWLSAAALAIKHGVSLRKLDYRLFHKSLLDNGAVLPGVNVA